MKPVLQFSLFCAVVLTPFVTPAANSQHHSASLFDGSSVQDFGPEAPVPDKGGGSGFGVDYAFKGGTYGDGAVPTAALIQDPAGNLYGTTSQGGNQLCNNVGCGTVFKVDTRNHETVLHVFAGSPDGATPNGRLVADGSGNLYGTTSYGGTSSACASGCGTVFKIDSSGTETVLHSFTGSPDGANPYAGLVTDGAGDVYGTTESGGTFNFGTIFKIDASGNESVLYSFKGSPDGADPKAGLALDPDGNLYGTTFSGGSGDGTVFELDTSGTETILWNFTGGADGANPFGGVIRDTNGVLYGTTENGGVTQLGPVLVGGGPIEDRPHGCCGGVGFALSGGNLSVLYTFTGHNDGGNPTCDLVLHNGVLYGTTSNGGPGNSNKGVAFSLTIATKTETVLHGFKGASDGGTPQAGLLLNGAGILYGTAEKEGGPNRFGTVFQYKLK